MPLDKNGQQIVTAQAAAIVYGPYSEGEKTNPSAADVLATTPAMPAGAYEVLVTAGGSAAADFALQVRNAPNGATVSSVVIKGPAGQSGQYRFFVQLVRDQVVRVVMDDALTGTAAVGLNLRTL